MSDGPKLGIANYFPLLLPYIMPDNFLARKSPVACWLDLRSTRTDSGATCEAHLESMTRFISVQALKDGIRNGQTRSQTSTPVASDS